MLLPPSGPPSPLPQQPLLPFLCVQLTWPTTRPPGTTCGGLGRPAAACARSKLRASHPSCVFCCCSHSGTPLVLRVLVCSMHCRWGPCWSRRSDQLATGSVAALAPCKTGMRMALRPRLLAQQAPPNWSTPPCGCCYLSCRRMHTEPNHTCFLATLASLSSSCKELPSPVKHPPCAPTVATQASQQDRPHAP